MALEEKNAVGVIWGAEEIGKAIGKSKRQTFHLLEEGQLQGAVKIGGRWAITLRALAANFPMAGIERENGGRPSEDREPLLASE